MMLKKYTTTILSFCLLILFAVLFVPITGAEAGGYPWKNHAKPYDFLFGNNIDSHQQTRLKSNGELHGFLYITFTGVAEDGTPVADHCNESTPANECEVGWIIRGKFLGKENAPTFVYKTENDHPTWLVESRNDIPQPGAYSHFHWLGDPQSGGDLVGLEGESFNGYVLELQAVDKFYFTHNGEEILVMPGIDISTHVNIVGSPPPGVVD